MRRGPAIALVLVVATAASAAAPAATPRLVESCSTAKERAGAIAFRAADGTRLAGVLLGRGPRAAVLGHEYGADLCSWLPYGRHLAARSYRVLVLDFRGSGSSASAAKVENRRRLDLDYAAAVVELRRRGARRVAVAGGSMGGNAAIVAAAAIRPPVDGAASVSGPASFIGTDALAAARRLRVPVLFMAGEYDKPYSDDAVAMYRAARSAKKELLIVRGSARHGSALVFGAAEKKLDSFLRAALR